MCDCRKKPKSFPKVHLFPKTMQEHVQGMQAIRNPCVERKGHGRSSRKPFGSMRIYGHISRGVSRVST